MDTQRRRRVSELDAARGNARARPARRDAVVVFLGRIPTRVPRERFRISSTATTRDHLHGQSGHRILHREHGCLDRIVLAADCERGHAVRFQRVLGDGHFEHSARERCERGRGSITIPCPARRSFGKRFTTSPRVGRSRCEGRKTTAPAEQRPARANALVSRDLFGFAVYFLMSSSVSFESAAMHSASLMPCSLRTMFVPCTSDTIL